MSIPMSTRCLMCNLQRNVEKAKALGDDQKAVAFGKQLMRMYADAPEGVSSPWFTAGTADLFREFYGLERLWADAEQIDLSDIVMPN